MQKHINILWVWQIVMSRLFTDMNGKDFYCNFVVVVDECDGVYMLMFTFSFICTILNVLMCLVIVLFAWHNLLKTFWQFFVCLFFQKYILEITAYFQILDKI